MVNKVLSRIVTLLGTFTVATAGLIPTEKIWSYEIQSIIANTSAHEKSAINLEIERIVEFMVFPIEVRCFRSTHNTGDYKPLPYQVPSDHFFKILNTYYKDVFMGTLKDCSDLPIFEDTFQPPLEKKTYKLNKCKFSEEGLPNYMQEGFYKILIVGTGDVEWYVEIIAEVIIEV